MTHLKYKTNILYNASQEKPLLSVYTVLYVHILSIDYNASHFHMLCIHFNASAIVDLALSISTKATLKYDKH